MHSFLCQMTCDYLKVIKINHSSERALKLNSHKREELSLETGKWNSKIMDLYYTVLSSLVILFQMRSCT